MSEPPHLSSVIRAALKRRPRNPPAPRGRGHGGAKAGAVGEGEAPVPRNNYIAEAPKAPVGAKPANRNARKHGRFSAESRARRAALKALVSDISRRVAEAIALAEAGLADRGGDRDG